MKLNSFSYTTKSAVPSRVLTNANGKITPTHARTSSNMKHTFGDLGPSPFQKMASKLHDGLIHGFSQMVIVIEDKESMTAIDSPICGLVLDLCQSLLGGSCEGTITMRAACGEIKKTWITNLLTKTKMQLIVDFEAEQLVPNRRSTRSIATRKEMEDMIQDANAHREGNRHSFIGLYVEREYQGKLYRGNFVLLNLVADGTIIELGDCPKGNSVQKQKEQFELLCVEMSAKTDEEKTFHQSQSNILTARFYDFFLTARVYAIGFESNNRGREEEASLLDLTLECISKMSHSPKQCIRYIHDTSTHVSHGLILSGKFQQRYFRGGGVHPLPHDVHHHPHCSDRKKRAKGNHHHTRPSLAQMTRTNLKRLPEHLYHERRVLGRNRRKFDLRCPVTSKWASMWEQEMKTNPIHLPSSAV